MGVGGGVGGGVRGGGQGCRDWLGQAGGPGSRDWAGWGGSGVQRLGWLVGPRSQARAKKKESGSILVGIEDVGGWG